MEFTKNSLRSIVYLNCSQLWVCRVVTCCHHSGSFTLTILFDFLVIIGAKHDSNGIIVNLVKGLDKNTMRGSDRPCEKCEVFERKSSIINLE